MKKLLLSMTILIGFNTLHALSDHHRNKLMELDGIPQTEEVILHKDMLREICRFNSYSDLQKEGFWQELSRQWQQGNTCENFINRVARLHHITGSAKAMREAQMNAPLNPYQKAANEYHMNTTYAHPAMQAMQNTPVDPMNAPLDPDQKKRDEERMNGKR